MMKLVVFSCLVAAACGGIVAPIAYSTPWAYAAPIAYANPWSLAASNYRGPLSLAPGQPANILGSDGRPLDTLEVNQAKLDKAFKEGVHFLKKRSVVFPSIAAPLVAQTPLITPADPILNRLAPLAYSAPYTAYAAPYTTYW